jgi:hypothetical protein
MSSQPGLMLVGKAGSYPGVEHLKGASLGFATALLANTRQGCRQFAGTKHSSLL